MDNISDLLGKIDQFKIGGKGGINSQRADMIDQLMEFMGEKSKPPAEINRRFKYWLGRTRSLHPNAIFEMIKQAKSGKNPQALFNYLLKKHAKEKREKRISRGKDQNTGRGNHTPLT